MKSPLLLLLLALATLLGGCKTTETTGHGTAKSTPTHHGTRRTVRTTAYCHMEDGNRSNGIGGRLRSDHIHSAAADWSRFPVGTEFRVVPTGRRYVIDDYGKAMVGTDTIDLYVPTMREMRKWGVRRVEIEIIHWGSYKRSLDILRPRTRASYVRRMVGSLESKVR